jgi:hypothetical protein
MIMAWFSKFFGGGSKEFAMQALAQQQAQQQAAAAAAEQQRLTNLLAEGQAAAAAALEEQNRKVLEAQKAAEEASYRASLSPGDSEDARTAQDTRIKRLLGRRGLASMFGRGSPLGAPATAAPALTGA